MDSPPPQFAFNQRLGRNESQLNNDRWPSEPHHSSVNSPALYKGQMQEPSQSYHHPGPPQNMGAMRQPPEQSDPLNRFRTRHPSTSSSSNAPFPQHDIASKSRTGSTTLHFNYQRYPSPPPPPPSEPGIPTRYPNPPSFPHPAPSAQQPMRIQTHSHQPRTASSPPQHSSSPTLTRAVHRANESSSSSAGNSPLATLPPLSRAPHRPPMHRGVDQSPNHQHVDMISPPAQQMRSSATQLPGDKTEQQGPVRRHTVDSAQVLNQQVGSSTGGRQRTLSSLPPPPGYPAQPQSPLLRLVTQQQAPVQPSQTNPTSKPYPIPLPWPAPRRQDPPASAVSPTSPPQPSMSQPPQQPPQPPPSQSPQSPQPANTEDTIPDISLTETVDTALEPLRLGFESVLTQTVQNVHQVMSKMQKDFTRLISAERRKNSYLMRCLVNSSEKLKGQEWAVEELKKENDSFKERAVENGRLKMENTQKLTVIDSLNQENNFLRRENNELRKKNDEVKEALTRAAGFVFQYKEELDKVRADIDTLRKSREASTLSPQTTAASSDLQREMTRLHAERERERIFNDAVKQLRALTALEDSQHSNPDTTRQRDSEEMVVVEPARALSDVVDRDRDRRIQTSLLGISTSKQNLSPLSVVAEVHDTITEHHPGPSALPPPTKVVLTEEEEESDVEADDEPDSREIVDVDMNGGGGDDDNVTVIPPIRMTTPPNPAVEPDVERLENDLEQKMQSTDKSRNLIEESRPQHLELETHRQKRRQARRGPTSPSPISSSPPQTRSKKNLNSKTGMKRNRDEYEDGQEGDATIEELGVVGGERMEEDPTQIVHSPSSAEREVIHADAENSEVDDDVVPDGEQQDVDISIGNIPKDKTRRKVTTDERQVVPMTLTSSNKLPVKDVHPKALGRWKYYTHYRDNSAGCATPSVTPQQQQQQSTSLSPPSQNQRAPKRHPKLGINHMDLLYKTEKEVMACRICLSLEQNPDSTSAERRKARANTKKFPLNASWAELINHCQTEHTKACEEMEKLSPSQIAEMKQRKSPGSGNGSNTR